MRRDKANSPGRRSSELFGVRAREPLLVSGSGAYPNSLVSFCFLHSAVTEKRRDGLLRFEFSAFKFLVELPPLQSVRLC